MSNKLHNLPQLKPLRQRLRSHMTSAEIALWVHLQRSRLDGRKFRRQHSIGRCIVDFYCPMERLAIELDGSPHDTESGWQRDQDRAAFLQSQGIRVVRFENRDVLNNLEGVLSEIRRHFADK
jgi:very-short-patch-repair endonuclease